MSVGHLSEKFSIFIRLSNQHTYWWKCFRTVLSRKCGNFQNTRTTGQHSFTHLDYAVAGFCARPMRISALLSASAPHSGHFSFRNFTIKNNFDETGFIKVTIWIYLSVSYGCFTNYFLHHYQKFLRCIHFKHWIHLFEDGNKANWR